VLALGKRKVLTLIGEMVASEEAHQDTNQFLKLQYETLRKEIETRQDRHFKIAAGSLLVVPAVPTLAKALEGIKGTGAIAWSTGAIAWALLMLLPVIVLSLYVLYFSEHLAIRRCARYIRDCIEEKRYDGSDPSAIKGWETWLKEEESEDPRIRDHEKLQKAGLYFLYIPSLPRCHGFSSRAGNFSSNARNRSHPLRRVGLFCRNDRLCDGGYNSGNLRVVETKTMLLSRIALVMKLENRANLSPWRKPLRHKRLRRVKSLVPLPLVVYAVFVVPLSQKLPSTKGTPPSGVRGLVLGCSTIGKSCWLIAET
jgi:hypothetical protein